jgi:2-polyprenyl-3-methyl-5-hydroxy-6-metoxy-1,4-benzoquinol methylase
MKIVYYNPFLLCQNGFVSRPINTVNDDPVIKELLRTAGPKTRILVFTVLPVKTFQVLTPNLYLLSAGEQQPGFQYGVEFEAFVRTNPIDVLVFDRHIKIDLKFRGKAKIVISDKQILKIEKTFRKLSSNKTTLYHYLVHTSDYYLAKQVSETYSLGLDDDDQYQNVRKSWCNTEKEHDDWGRDLLENGENHLIGEFDKQKALLTRLRFTEFLSGLPAGSNVLDYGCQIGQITYYLANKYPELNFMGVDISPVQIEQARQYLSDLKYNPNRNVEFEQCSKPSELIQQYDSVICMEVLEHLWYYNGFLEELELCCVEDGLLLITTPYGVYEGLSFPIFKPGQRQHFHNFEEQDIVEIVGDKKDFMLSYVSNDLSDLGDKNGHYGWMWRRDSSVKFGRVNYQRKEREQNPYLNHDNLFIKKLKKSLGKWYGSIK